MHRSAIGSQPHILLIMILVLPAFLEQQLLQHFVFLDDELHACLKIFDLGHVVFVDFIVDAVTAELLLVGDHREVAEFADRLKV
jgi:hypothetical protein